MKTILAASLLFLLAALGIEHLGRASAGDFAPRVERLVELPEKASVSALVLAGPELGGELAYVRAKGLWRSREAFGAVCDEAQIQKLVAACTHARGELLTSDPARAARYGLAEEARLAIGLCGPKFLEREDRDLFASLELGRGVARRGGENGILTIDRDPRALLERPAPELPPFVDARLLAGCFGPGFVGFRRIELAYADGRAFALDGAPSSSPDAPPEWTLEREGTRTSALVWRPGGYTSLWIRARARGFENPKRAAALGLDRPWLRITLVPSEGEKIELDLGERSPANEAWLWNRRTNVLMRVDGELVPEMAPEAGAFTDAARANPWERWLMR